jgi:hypothetical protein
MTSRLSREGVQQAIDEQDEDAEVVVVDHDQGRTLARREGNRDAKVRSAVVVVMGAPEVDEPR